MSLKTYSLFRVPYFVCKLSTFCFQPLLGGLREWSVVNCAVLRAQEEMIIAFSTRISPRIGVAKLKWVLGEERRRKCRPIETTERGNFAENSSELLRPRTSCGS
jgi:hypothetical protein